MHASQTPFRVRIAGLWFTLAVMWHVFLVTPSAPATPFGYAARLLPLAIVFGLGFYHLVKKTTVAQLDGLSILFGVLIVLSFIKNVMLTRDIPGLMEYIMFFGGLYGYRQLARHYPITPLDVAGGFLVLVFPILSILELFPFYASRHEFGLIPFLGDNWRVVIEAIHFTGQGGALAFFAGAVLLRRGRRRVGLLIMGVAAYLVLFSGSRTSLAAILVAAAVLFLPWVRRMVLRSRFVAGLGLLLCASILYLIPFLVVQGVSLGGFADRLLRLQSDDVSAGRALTWAYHLNLFFENLWTGAPESAVAEFGSDELEGSYESFFTRILARQGVWSLLFLSAFMGLALEAVKRTRVDAYALSLMFVLLAAGQGTFGTTYGLFALVGFWLYFSLLESSDEPKSTKKAPVA